MTNSPETMKRDAMAFYDLMFNQGRPGEAVDLYVGTATGTTEETGP